MSSEQDDTRSRIIQATWRLLEENRGQGVSMNAIARATGISRQAVYLHFPSRTELIASTVKYVDEVKGLNQRLEQFNLATTGPALLDACVDVWGNYIPEIYSLAKAMMLARDSDEDMASAWDNCMACLHDACKQTIDVLAKENSLSSEWTKKTAAELLYTLLSISNWEQLTQECNWSQKQYIERMKQLLKHTFT